METRHWPRYLIWYFWRCISRIMDMESCNFWIRIRKAEWNQGRHLVWCNQPVGEKRVDLADISRKSSKDVSGNRWGKADSAAGDSEVKRKLFVRRNDSKGNHRGRCKIWEGWYLINSLWIEYQASEKMVLELLFWNNRRKSSKIYLYRQRVKGRYVYKRYVVMCCNCNIQSYGSLWKY